MMLVLKILLRFLLDGWRIGEPAYAPDLRRITSSRSPSSS